MSNAHKSWKGLAIKASKNPTPDNMAALNAALSEVHEKRKIRTERRIAAGLDERWVHSPNRGWLSTRKTPLTGGFSQPPAANHTVGDATAARYDFLAAAAKGGSIGVNRRHCRPLHPHGLRLVKDGLMTLSRSGSKSCRHTALHITEKGLAELARLRKRLGIPAPSAA